MIRLEMKNNNMILTEQQQKYQHYHLEKLMKLNVLQVKKYYHLNKEEYGHPPTIFYSEKKSSKLSWPMSAKSDEIFFIQKEKKQNYNGPECQI